MKKTKKPDSLESKKFIFFQLGLIISLSLVLLAFEWGTHSLSPTSGWDRITLETPSELVLITKHKEVKKPPVPEPVKIREINNDRPDPGSPRIDAGMHPGDPVVSDLPDFPLPEEPPAVDDPPLMAAQKMPEFPGGLEAMMAYLSKNVKYTREAIEYNVRGTVYVTFIVEKDGRVTHVELLRGIGFGCDEVALEAVRNMPPWTPGRQNMMPVRVQFNLPVKFNLR